MLQSTGIHDHVAQAVGALVETLLESLNSANVRYCVLHNYEGLPTRIGNDLDIMIDSRNARFVFDTLVEVSQAGGWKLVRRIVRRGTRTMFLAMEVEGRQRFVHVDIADTLVVRRVVWGKATYILDNLRPYRNFCIPQPGCEAALAVRGLLVEGTIREKYRESSARYVADDYPHFAGCLAGHFNPELVRQLGDLISRKEWQALVALAPRVRRNLLARALVLRGPTQFLRFLEFVIQRVQESFRPTGLFLVLIGPDGSGKTTIAKALQEHLANTLFAGTWVLHRYFGVLPPLSSLLRLGRDRGKSSARNAPVSDGIRRDSGRSLKLSLFRALANVLYYMWDFLLFHVPLRRATGKGKLVIFDRYFYDHLIQPSYSRVPRCLLRGILRIIPSPDLVVYLRSDAEQIHARKNELTVEEIREQSRGCELFLRHCTNGFTVETNGSIDETINAITAEICRVLSERESRRS